MSQKMFLHVCSMIAQGNAAWGVLTANEYLDTRDPLRLAICARARPALARGDLPPQIREAVLEGHKLSEIEERWQESRQLLKNEKDGAPQLRARSRPAFTEMPAGRSSFTARRSLRGRSALAMRGNYHRSGTQVSAVSAAASLTPRNYMLAKLS